MSTNLTIDLIEAAGQRVCDALRGNRMPDFSDLKALRNCQAILPQDVAEQLLMKLRTNVRNLPVTYSLASKIVMETISRRGGWDGE